MLTKVIRLPFAQLVKNISPIPIALDGEQKQAAPRAGLLPLVAYLLLFSRVVVSPVRLAFVFNR